MPSRGHFCFLSPLSLILITIFIKPLSCYIEIYWPPHLLRQWWAISISSPYFTLLLTWKIFAKECLHFSLKESDFRRATYENWPRPILHFRLFDRRRRTAALQSQAQPGLDRKALQIGDFSLKRQKLVLQTCGVKCNCKTALVNNHKVGNLVVHMVYRWTHCLSLGWLLFDLASLPM